MTDTVTASTLAKSGVLFLRLVQVTLVLLAVLLVVGSLSMPVITAVFLWVFALVLLAFAGVGQVVIGGIRGRWGETDAT